MMCFIILYTNGIGPLFNTFRSNTYFDLSILIMRRVYKFNITHMAKELESAVRYYKCLACTESLNSVELIGKKYSKSLATYFRSV